MADQATSPEIPLGPGPEEQGIMAQIDHPGDPDAKMRDLATEQGEQLKDQEALWPGQEMITDGKPLPYHQITPGNDTEWRDSKGRYWRDGNHSNMGGIFIMNQQGEVVAYTYNPAIGEEGLIDSEDYYNYDGDEGGFRREPTIHLQDKIIKDIQQNLGRRGLTAYKVVVDDLTAEEERNPDFDRVRVELRDLTGGKEADDPSYISHDWMDLGLTYVLEQDETLKEPHNQREGGVAELGNLLVDPAFHERFIRTQTAAERSQVNAVITDANKAVEQKLRPYIDAAAAASVGAASVEEGRRLGRAWGEALRAVTHIKTESEAVIPVEDARSQFKDQFRPEFEARMAQAQQSLREAEVKQRQVLTQLQQELEGRQADPALLDAMDVWGRSPDARGNRGLDGQGMHAGMIHYFEYRDSEDKNSRYKVYDPVPSIEGFIRHSRQLREIITDPNPASNPAVKAARIIEDDQGQRRIYVLTSHGVKIVGFLRAGEPMRVITVIPGANEKAVQKDADSELIADPNDPREQVRLNRLGGGRKEVAFETREAINIKFNNFSASLEQTTTRGDGVLQLGESFSKEDIDLQSTLDHLRIHHEGVVAGSQFNGAIFENPQQVQQLLARVLPESLQYDQFGRAELTLTINTPNGEPIGWTGVKSKAELEQAGVTIEKKLRIPGGIEDTVDGIAGAWYPEMVYDPAQKRMVVAVDEQGQIKNPRGKFEPKVNIATVSGQDFHKASQTNKLTFIIQKDRASGKPVVLTVFPGDNAPPIPSRLNIIVVNPGEQPEIIDNLRNPVMSGYWEDHVFVRSA